MGNALNDREVSGAEADFRPRRSFVAHPAGYPWRVGRLQSSRLFHRLIGLSASYRRGARNSCSADKGGRGVDAGAAFLSFVPRLGEFAVARGEDDRLASGQLVGGRDVADGAVQADGVVMLDVLLDQLACIVQAQGRSRADALGLEGFVIAFELAV